MPYKKVVLSDERRLRPALMRLNRQVFAQIREGMYRTARFGHVRVVQATKRHGAVATMHYINAWEVRKTTHGAVLGNSAYHSYFMEVGRHPGAPPLKPILEWIAAKKISMKVMQDATGRGPLKGKRRGTRKRKGPLPTSISESRMDGKARATSKRKRRASANHAIIMKSFAFLIQRVIAKRGIRGRRVLGEQLPVIAKRAVRESRNAVKIAIRNHRG